jgi:uncharacterized protein
MEVIVKPTGACNGTCVYCSASRCREEAGALAARDLAGLFAPFRSWLQENPRQGLRFIWHGGEPLLRGREFYRTVAAQENRIFGTLRPRVRNMLQSNLSLVTPGWIPCLRNLVGDETIGTSFDVIPGIRGLDGGRNLAEDWIRAVMLLRAHDFRIGVVYVVHRKSLDRARDLFYFFANLDPSLGLRFNPLYPEGRAAGDACRSLWISPEEYGRFLLDLCDVWRQERERISVTPLAEWKRVWNGDRNLSCENNGRCHETHLGIDWDGSVFGCGREADAGVRKLGNIFVDPLEEILRRPTRGQLSGRGDRLKAGPCRDCRYWPLCHGGCPSEAWLYHNDFFQKTYFCPARKMIFERFERLFGPPRPAEVIPYA